MKQIVQQGIDVVLYINSNPVAGQMGATLNQSMSPIKITNKITGKWEESIDGLRSWNIKCNGLYVKSEESFQELLEAFMNNQPLSVSLTVGGKQYLGNCLITDFPIQAVYNSQFKYNMTLLGTGALRFEAITTP